MPRQSVAPFSFETLFEQVEESSGSANTNIDRIVYSYCALYGDTFTSGIEYSFSDRLLNAYRNVGVNGIWCQAVLHTLVPFPFAPELSVGWEKRLEGVRLLTERFDLLEAHYSEHHYPLHVTGSFVSSDEQLNQIWNVSINTLQCCMQETYMDCPHYEQLQYVMDYKQDDYALFERSAQWRRIHLNPGDFVIIFPGEAHCPTLSATGAGETIKKAVGKFAYKQN